MAGSNIPEINDSLFLCWGKTGRIEQSPQIYHPAAFHMVDVGNIAQTLLSSPSSPRWRTVLSRATGIPRNELIGIIPYLIALHDIGKISAPFQGKVIPQADRLVTAGFSFGKMIDLPHATAGQIHLKDADLGIELPDNLRLVLREMVGGHHGRFTPPGDLADARVMLRRYEPAGWQNLRKVTTEYLQRIFLTSPFSKLVDPPDISAAVMVLTGFTILCDWLGSDERFFTPQPGFDPNNYPAISSELAHRAVEQAGFLLPASSNAPAHFSALFPKLSGNPRPLQEAVDSVPDSVLSQPCLAVIEAPTGEGKTEAALALAHRIARLTGTDELYYALPTTATSNQMFRRVQEHLQDRLGLPLDVKLIHGQAFLMEDDFMPSPLLEGSRSEPSASLEWFGPKKRALLAPFGVGTIDQAELGALNVSHMALRLAGLAGKVLIVDEVHAYDTYMTTIIERLLSWLSPLGTSVILLSATLPQMKRAALARAYGIKQNLPPEVVGAYPQLWVANSEASYVATPMASQPGRSIFTRRLAIGNDEVTKASWLLDQIQSGGCACWITNTVDRAQRLFEAFDRIAPQTVERCLIHSQFPLVWRQILEQRLVERYGPEHRDEIRPKGVVIGTQVLEQSLDLDFDVMVSDIAPVDLLLQRAGRLHRHDRARQLVHSAPHLWIYVNDEVNNKLPSGVDGYIYPDYLIQKTWETMKAREAVHLPADYRPMIEAVYDGAPPPPGDPLEKAWAELLKQETHAEDEAYLRLIPRPKRDDTFTASFHSLNFEENEDSAAWIVAQTRLGEESLTLIPLERSGNNAFCPDLDNPIPLDQPASREIQLHLLRHSLRVSRRAAILALKPLAETKPRLFIDSALLKNCQPLFLENGTALVHSEKSTLEFILDPRLGLVIRKH